MINVCNDLMYVYNDFLLLFKGLSAYMWMDEYYDLSAYNVGEYMNKCDLHMEKCGTGMRILLT